MLCSNTDPTAVLLPCQFQVKEKYNEGYEEGRKTVKEGGNSA